MEPIEIKLDGKIYEIDFSKFTKEQIKRLWELEVQGVENKDAKFEALEIMMGIEREKINELDERIINKICAIIKFEALKMIRLQSH